MHKHKWMGFIQITILYILQNMNSYLTIPNYNQISQELGVTDTYLGVMTGGYIFFSGIAALLWSYASDAKGLERKILLGSSYFLAGVLTILVLLTKNPYVILFLWILVGGMLGGIIPLGFSVLSDLFEPRRRTSIFMLWDTIGGIGLGLGYGMALFLGMAYGWRFPLFVNGFILLSLGTFLSLTMPEPPRGRSDMDSMGISKYFYPYKFRPQDLGFILKNKSNIYLAIQGIFGTIPNGIIFTWTVYYIMRYWHTNELLASLVLGLMSTGALGGLFLSYLVDKLYEKKAVIRPLAAGVCSITEAELFSLFFIMPVRVDIFTQDLQSAFIILANLLLNNAVVFSVFVIFFIAMFFNSPVGAIRDSTLTDINLPEDRSTVLSGMIIAELLSKSIGIIFIGLLSDIMSDLRYPLIIAMQFWVLSGIAWLYMLKFYERDMQNVREVLRKRLENQA